MNKPDSQTIAEWNESCKYEDHFVAMLDILGFSNLVNMETNNYAIAGCLDLVERMTKTGKLIEATKFYNLKSAIISDSIVLSIKSDGADAFYTLCRAISAIWITFAENNMVLRGGITRGKLLHLNNNVVFGPALVDAHRLESEIAIYPRIVIDKTIEDYLVNDPSMWRYFTEDHDDIKFLDIIGATIYCEYNTEKGIKDICTFKKLITEGISENKGNERVKLKYLWMRGTVNHWINEAYKNGLVDSSWANNYLITDND